MNTATLNPTPVAQALGVEPLQVSPDAPQPRRFNLQPQVSKLYQGTLQALSAAGAGAVAAAALAVRLVQAIWRWLASLLRLQANRMGSTANVPEQLSDEQASGQEAIEAELKPKEKPAMPSQPAEAGASQSQPASALLSRSNNAAGPLVPPALQEAALQSEVSQLVDHILAAAADPARFANADDRRRYYEAQMIELGRWLRAAVQRQVQAERQHAEQMAALSSHESGDLSSMHSVLSGAPELSALLDPSAELAALRDKARSEMALAQRIASVIQALTTQAPVFDYAEERALKLADEHAPGWSDISKGVVTDEVRNGVGSIAQNDPTAQNEYNAQQSSAFGGKGINSGLKLVMNDEAGEEGRPPRSSPSPFARVAQMYQIPDVEDGSAENGAGMKAEGNRGK